jgi:hypothetical protein
LGTKKGELSKSCSDEHQQLRLGLIDDRRERANKRRMEIKRIEEQFLRDKARSYLQVLV